MGLLDKLKANREKSTAAVIAAIEEKNYENEFYYPERDQQGAASVIIRFLPQKDPDAVPFVSLFRHMFKGDDGKWLIADLCGTTIGEECEICKRNTELWNTNDPEKQAVARSRKRKKEYICNILVIKDPRSPEKEGKVFPYRFGPTIYEKIKSAITPSYDDEPVINPFDLWEGADFLLRIRKDTQSKQITYDDSKFAKQSALFDGDEKKLLETLEQCVDLSKYVDKNLIIDSAELSRRCDAAYSNYLNTKNNIKSNNQTLNSTSNNEPTIDYDELRVSTQESKDENDPLATFRNLVNEVPF